MKLQQPRNYDFRVSRFDPPRSQSGNDRETTTKVATTVKRRLLHLAIIERQIFTLTTTAKPQQLRVNSREMTTFAASCNDREMQRPRSDKFETAQLLQILHKILCRFMAVVVSSAFWKSLRYPPKIPKYQKKHRKFTRTFAYFPVTRVRNPMEIVQKKTCSDELFYFGWIFWVDFPPLISDILLM